MRLVTRTVLLLLLSVLGIFVSRRASVFGTPQPAAGTASRELHASDPVTDSGHPPGGEVSTRPQAGGTEAPPPCPAAQDAGRWRHKAKTQCAGRGQPPWAQLREGRLSLLRPCHGRVFWHPCLLPAQEHALADPVLEDECVVVVCGANRTYLTKLRPLGAALGPADRQAPAPPFNVLSLLVDSVSVAHLHRDALPRTLGFLRRLRARPDFHVFDFCSLRVVGVGSAHNQAQPVPRPHSCLHPAMSASAGCIERS